MLSEQCHMETSLLQYIPWSVHTILFCFGHNPPYVLRLLRVRMLRRCNASNSASPAADWGLKVILQPPYRQRTSLAAAVPPTHRIAHRKSHSEGTFNVLAPCLRGTFNVRSPCHRPRVRTAVCVSVPQWHGAGALKSPLTCVARTDISSLPRVFSELITGIPENLSSTLLNTVKTHQLTWHGTPGDWDCSGCIWWQRDSAETTLSWPWLLGKDNGWSWWADRFPPRLFGLFVSSPRWADDNAWDYIF